jgi:NAD(P)H-hydrate epimerase
MATQERLVIRLTRAQVREIDRQAIEQYHIPGIVLMENAARAITDVACDMLDGNCVGQIVILCGGGNNGGDGLAAARHLHNLGADVYIALTTDPTKYKEEAKINWDIVRAMGLKTFEVDPDHIAHSRAVLVLDAVFGTGLAQAPRDPFPALADAVNRSGLRVLAIDVPSGLDCDTGETLGACIKAERTVTFVAEKAGFTNPNAAQYTGKVCVGDIGCPIELVDQVLTPLGGTLASPSAVPSVEGRVTQASPLQSPSPSGYNRAPWLNWASISITSRRCARRGGPTNPIRSGPRSNLSSRARMGSRFTCVRIAGTSTIVMSRCCVRACSAS